MPWQSEAMKDVEICEKPWEADKQAVIQGSPNGETHLSQGRYLLTEYIGLERRTRGTETSKYPEEKKSTEIPPVAASERGPAERCELVEHAGKCGHSG